MSDSDFSRLLSPTPNDPPCGPDLSLSPEFLELETLVKGKEETQFSDAVKADWKQVADRCLQLSEVTKHLQLPTTLCVAELELHGLEGAAPALEFLATFTETFWGDLHPKLDPTDNLDPLERLNILSTLTTPLGTFGDPYRFLQRLAAAPLTDSPVLGKIAYCQIHTTDFPDNPDFPPLDRTQIEAAFRDTPIERLESLHSSLTRMEKALAQLRTFLDTSCPNAAVPDFQPVMNLIRALTKEIIAYLPNEEIAPDAGEPSAKTPQPRLTGEISNRDDVTLAIDRICQYYRRSEPSSPVPLLLDRAKRLVHSDFLAIVGDLAPDALAQVHSATGSKPTET